MFGMMDPELTMMAQEQMSRIMSPAELQQKRLKATRDGVDYISALPDDVLLLVMSRLKLIDVVKTSVLSHRWRHISAYIDKLKFGWQNIFKSGTIPTSCKEYGYRIVRIVNQCIESFKGPCLVSFELYFCLGRDSFSDVDKWIGFASKMRVRQLFLHFSCFKCEQPSLDELYKFPMTESKLNLSLLHLRSCLLVPAVIHQFGSLVKLKLVKVPLWQHEVLDSIFSCCSRLRYLVLRICSLPMYLSIPSESALLRHLKYLFILDCSGVKMIELSAIASASLTNFHYIGATIPNPFSRVRVAALEKVHFQLRYTKSARMQCIYSKCPDHLPLLDPSHFHKPCVWVRETLENMPMISRISMITQIDLFFPKSSKFCVSKLVDILGAFPYLQILSLVIAYQENNIESVKQVCETATHEHLNTVKIGGYCANENVIEFVICLLKCAVSLDSLIIHPNTEFPDWKVGQRTSWGEGEREKVCRRLEEFNNKQVQIIVHPFLP